MAAALGCLHSAQAVVDLGLQAVSHCAAASQLLLPMLAQMVFAPLFTLLLALNARLFKCVAAAVLHLHACFDPLLSQVQVRHVSSRHACDTL